MLVFVHQIDRNESLDFQDSRSDFRSLRMIQYGLDLRGEKSWGHRKTVVKAVEIGGRVWDRSAGIFDHVHSLQFDSAVSFECGGGLE